MTDKATRAEVSIGPLSVDGYQMPDGTYRMSQVQAAECIGTTAQNASNFLRSKAFKALRGKGFTDQVSEQIAVESAEQARGETRINAVPLDVVMLFWLYQCSRGNKPALGLLAALATETLERRFDAAFGVERTEEERQTRLAERMDISRAEYDALVESAAIPDDQREYISRLEDQVRRLGEEPLQIPSQEDKD